MHIGSSLIAQVDAVGGDDHPTGGDFVSHHLRRQVRLALGDAPHLRSDLAETRVLELGDRRKAVGERATFYPPLPGASVQSAGMKSHAVFFDGCGIPGVSGELKL